MGDVPSPPPLIDLSRLVRHRRPSSFRFASPSTPLSSLSFRGRTGSRPSANSPEDVSYSSSLFSDTNSSPTKAKVLAGASVGRSSAALPPTTPVASSSTASVAARTSAATIPIKRPASVSYQSAVRPTSTNTELVAATISPATPFSIFRTGSRPSVNSLEDVTYSSSLPSDAKSSPTMAKVLAGASVSRSSATPPPTLPAASSSTPGVTASTPATIPTKKPDSVSSQSAARPTTINAEVVAATIPPATPASIFGPSVNSPEDVTYSPSLSSDAKSSPTIAKVLAGASVSRSSAASPPTTPAASSSTASVTTRTPATIPIKKPDSVSSRSAVRPTITNAELVSATIPPAGIFTSPAISPTKRITPPASGPSHFESASASSFALINRPLPLSQSSTLPAVTFTIAVLPTSPSTPAASSRLCPVASPAALFEPLPPSQASTNLTQEEASVSKMVIENGNEGDTGNLAEVTAGNVELEIASRKFDKGEEKQPDLPPLSPLSSLSPSISGSPHRVGVSGLSTPLPRSALFTLLPRSPLASASSKNRTQIDQVPEAPLPPLNPFVAVVSSSCSPTTMDLVDDQPEPQSPLFNSPPTNLNDILVEQRNEEEEEIMSRKLKSPEDNNGTTNPAIPTAPSVLTHVPVQTSASIETLLPRDPSPISEVDKGGETVEGTDKTRVEKAYTSLGDNADIVRVKRRKMSVGSGMTKREPLTSSFAKGKGD